MLLIKNKIEDIGIYLIPLAFFFILISTALSNVFVALAVFASAFKIIKNKKYYIIFSEKIFIYSFLLFALLFTSYFYTIGSNEDFYTVIKKYIKFLYIPIIFYYIKYYCNKKKVLKYFIHGTTITLILSYLKYFEIFDFNSLYYFLESTNIAYVKDNIVNNSITVFHNYIIHGVILSFFSFVTFLLARKESDNLYYYLLSALSFINIIFLNDSRTAYLIILFLVILLVYKSIFPRKIFIYIVPLILLLFITFGSAFDNISNRFAQLSSDMEISENENYVSSLGLRYLWLDNGINNILKNPFLGSGAGSFSKTMSQYLIQKKLLPEHKIAITNNTHNEFVSISSQIGLIGLLLYLLFNFAVYVKSRNDIISQGIFATILISSLFNSIFYDNILGLFFIMLISLIANNDKEWI